MLKCGSTKIWKNGTRENTGVQKYICGECKSSKREINDTILFSTNKHILYWKQYLKLLNYNIPLRDIANELRINIKTAFLWRHKIMASLENFDAKSKLSDRIWLDEMQFSISHKGKRTRENARRHGKDPVKDINTYTVIVIVGIDDNDNIITIAVGTGKVLKQDLAYKYLANRIEEKSTIITDNTNGYNKLIKKLELSHISYKSLDHSEETLLSKHKLMIYVLILQISFIVFTESQQNIFSNI